MVVAMIGQKRKQALVRIVVVVGGVTNIKSDLTEESKAEDLHQSRAAGYTNTLVLLVLAHGSMRRHDTRASLTIEFGKKGRRRIHLCYRDSKRLLSLVACGMSGSPAKLVKGCRSTLWQLCC